MALGSTPGIVVGVGVGAAASTAIQPALEIPRQEAWKRNAHRLLPVASLAALIAQGGVPLGDDQYDEAKRDGYDKDKLNALIYLAQTVPGFGEAIRILRRDPKGFADLFQHSLVKQGLDSRYSPGLTDLQHERMSLPVIALGIVRGLVDAPFDLPFTPPAGVGKVQAFPKSTLDALHEVSAFGFDVDDLFLQTAISGRPMGPESAAAAEFRGIIEHDDYLRAILEGDVRGEWAEAIFEHARQIPSVADYISAEIRGWIDRDARNTGIARHGMIPTDGDLLYKRTGRPATTHQVHIGYARGGRNASVGDDERATFTKAVLESDIRPEWEPLLWAQRYTFPPFFALRSLMQAGLYDQPRWEAILLQIGWPPFLAKDVSTHFTTQTTTATENPYLGKAENQLWTALHKAYVRTGALQSGVDPLLQALVPDDATRIAVFSLWDLERDAQSLAAPAA